MHKQSMSPTKNITCFFTVFLPWGGCNTSNQKPNLIVFGTRYWFNKSSGFVSNNVFQVELLDFIIKNHIDIKII